MGGLQPWSFGYNVSDKWVRYGLSSVAGVIAVSRLSPYVAATHAVVGLTKPAAVEHARHKIRVSAITLGLVRTPMAERWLSDPEFEGSSPHNIRLQEQLDQTVTAGNKNDCS